MMQYYPNDVMCHNERHLYSTLCRVHFFLDEENWDASIHLTAVSSLVRMSEPRFRP